jgi:hypothetical protein
VIGWQMNPGMFCESKVTALATAIARQVQLTPDLFKEIPYDNEPKT